MKSYKLSAIQLGEIGGAYLDLTKMQTDFASGKVKPEDQPVHMAITFGALAKSLHACYPKHQPSFAKLGLSTMLTEAAKVMPRIFKDNAADLAGFADAGAAFGAALSAIVKPPSA